MRVRDFAVGLASPLETAKGELTTRRGVVVGAERGGPDSDGDGSGGYGSGTAGVRGVGEATPLPGWTESLADCRRTLREWADSDADAGEVVAAIDPAEHPAARHGVALAVQDAAAREAGESLAAHLADRETTVTERVPVNATIGAGTPAESAAAAKRAVERGFSCLKLKAGTGALNLDLQRVRAVREAVADDVTLRVDANGAWTAERARRAVDALATLDVAYVEQPLPAGDLAGMADLRGRGVGIAADEALTEYALDDVLDADAADVVVLKPMTLGGVDRARKAGRTARRAGVDVTITTTIDAVVARTAAVHLAASLPDALPCGLATGELLAEDLAPDPAPVADGSIVVPDGPGLANDTFDGLLE